MVLNTNYWYKLVPLHSGTKSWYKSVPLYIGTNGRAKRAPIFGMCAQSTSVLETPLPNILERRSQRVVFFQVPGSWVPPNKYHTNSNTFSNTMKGASQLSIRASTKSTMSTSETVPGGTMGEKVREEKITRCGRIFQLSVRHVHHGLGLFSYWDCLTGSFEE